MSSLNHTKVKVSYNNEVDRLHAKSYLFLRKTGFHTAYVGSSNLSAPALTEGLEWNIKVTQSELPDIIQKIRNSFEGYWNNDLFEEFIPGKDDERLKNALDKNYEAPIDYSILDLIQARDYQENILEKLRIEREVHHHYRNLIVAATGTGKTVIAAFDFKRFREQNPTARFLFIAHREEILKQSLKTFRQVLEDYNFGDLWDGNHEPTSYSQVFASKDIVNNRLGSLNLPDDYYDYIIIDEVHHIAASSYRKIVNKFKPKILLGLTATPERMDGEDITQDFDGHIAAEIRLDTALNNHLLWFIRQMRRCKLKYD
ncbi:DEAD/DEAH box helicase family protein [Prevotella cerevisiae]|uniref:DEAD/DEAH box helicase family protein n=1 Tax=Segatella cerevisiae TaxID=2053716 RepID=A0ABT1BZP3_9BACT|nr:DEAD/DEAH box helicase family protein [Segatella cerevisiae]MCO6026566.1 DEAD/DEAH box helicase family protein [Segatella cerevisiae]